MKEKISIRFKWISAAVTTILQSIYCYQVLFFDISGSIDFKLQLVAVLSLATSIIFLFTKDRKTKAVGLGILLGTILTAFVFSLTWLFALMNAFA